MAHHLAHTFTCALLVVSVAPAEKPKAGDPIDKKASRQIYNRAVEHERAKRYQHAIADYRRAGELDPTLFDAHFSRSALHADMGDYASTVEALTAALKARPKDYSALFNRGLYHQYLRKLDQAIADYTSALSKDADFSHHGGTPAECRAHAYHYRGRLYQWGKKEPAKAIADYTAALRLDPKIEMVRYRRGQVYHETREYAKAHADFEEAVKQDPDYSNLLNIWAWQLATCPDPKYRNGPLALRMATKTKHSETLAAAHAEIGDFEEAIAAQERAIALFDTQPKPKDKQAVERRTKRRKAMQSRLAGYEAGKPYRLPVRGAGVKK